MVDLLLVDDEKDLLEALDMVLSAEGHQTQAVDSARQALDILLESDNCKPDLIISDIMMPDMSGLELLETIRAHPGCADLPLLFISASIPPEMEAQIAQMGHVSFLRKPFQIDELCSMVDELCT